MFPAVMSCTDLRNTLQRFLICEVDVHDYGLGVVDGDVVGGLVLKDVEGVLCSWESCCQR